MRKLIACIILLGCTCTMHGQDFSNKGKDFWVAYGYHTIMRSTNAQEMVLYFATEQVTTITVTIPGLGYTQTYANIPANTVFTSSPLPKAGAQDARLLNESTSPENKGIHIESDYPIVAYAHIYNASISGASILFPTNTLGKEYYSINYTNNSNVTNANCWFYVIACDTGTTTVEIIPSASTINHAAGVPFTVTLTKGQVYNFLGQLTGNSGGLFTGVDLTGSKIRSISTVAGACKRIAVFSGSGRIGISCNNTGVSSDNYMVQSFPKNAWGKRFLTTPTSGAMTNNIYRVCVTDPSAAVLLNGVPIAFPLINGFYYEVPATSNPLKIEADKPITVAQYVTSQGNCGNGNPGDPEVIYLSPVEQNINSVIWNATPNFAITQHFFNVIISNKGTAISSFKLDGNPVNPALFVVHPRDPDFSYLTQPVSTGQRKIESDSGFNAIAYGFGAAESYGYNAGTNVKDLFQQVGVSSLYGIEQIPSVCTGSPFKFKVSLPYLADSIRWNLSGLPGSPPNVVKVYSNPAQPSDADSSTVVNGRTIYWYSLTNNYTLATAGTFPVSLSVFAASADGCGNEQLIDFELSVSAPPTVNFNWIHNGCINQTVQFSDATTSAKPMYKWYWDFGDPTSGAANKSTLQNPTHQYNSPGTYTVRFANINTPGCLSDTLEKTITINPLPTAILSGNVTVCQNSAPPNVTFNGTLGKAPFTFSYTINNGAAQTIVTTSGNSINLPVSTATVGTFIYRLVSVRDAAGTGGCFQNQPDTVTVNVISLPTASISGTATICQNAASPVITFTGAGAATAPYTFSYNINGGTTQTVTTTAGNAITVPVPTATAGTFIYNLLSVKDASATPCTQAQSGSATITINPLPTAGISGSVEVCRNATSPLVTFTGAGSVAPYTFTYSINGGANQSITSTGNTATVSVPTTIAGSFIYQLISVRDAGTTTCTQAQTGTVTVVVNPLPVSDFDISAPACFSSAIQFTDASTPGVGSLSTWAWNFGDPASGIANTSALQNPTHQFTSPGSYNVSLIVTNNKGCSNLASPKLITISPKPLAGFILPEVCLSDTYAQFIDTSKVALPGVITNWLWDFGDPVSGANNSSTLKSPQHSYTAVGGYNVKLTVTTGNGCTDEITQSLFVNGSFPVANFSVNNAASLCANDSVAIVEASTVFPGTITKVEIYWDNAGQPATFVSDNNPVSGKIYKHLYPNFQSPLTKSYTIRYRAYSGGICVNDKLQNIIVNAAPAVQFSAMPDACLDAAPFQITQARETGAVPGTAVYSGPGVSSSGIFNPAAVGPGTYRLFYRFTSTGGSCVDTASQVIKVLAAPLPDFTIGALQCATKNIVFTSTSTTPEGTLTNWAWDFGDGSAVVNSANGNPIGHTFNAAGSYNVSLVVTTSNGCRSIAKVIPVTVNALPISSFNMPASACLPAASVAFTNLSSPGTYLWNFGDPGSGTLNTSTAVNPTHVYTSNGPFSINLQTTNAAGCTKDTTRIFSAIHPQPIARFNTNVAEVCLGGTINFTDASNPMDGTTTQWNWNMGNNTTQSSSTFSYTYPAAGTYSVGLSIVNSFGCASIVYSSPVIIHSYPTVDAGANKFVLEGGTVIMDPVVSGSVVSYLWEPSTYLSATNIAKPTSSPLADIAYKLTVSNQGGCKASDTVFVKLLRGPQVPNTFSPNGDGINEKWVIEFLDTYPDNRVQVFTRAGQLVFESRGYKTPWNGTMNGKTLPIDTYYYIIEPGNGQKPMTGYVTILK